MDITGLVPDTWFVYGFIGPNGATSPTGLTRTAPALDQEVEELNYAVFSCANWAMGYFHAYDVASTMKDLDFWIHLGDYIYEYGVWDAHTKANQARPGLEPPWETTTLQDYRTRYALHTGKGAT